MDKWTVAVQNNIYKVGQTHTTIYLIFQKMFIWYYK